jgi:two-component system, NarL family, response regulator NreC
MTAHLHLAPEPATTGRDSLPQRSIRVVLADDHALMRRGLRGLLDHEEGIEVVAEASDLATVMHHLRRAPPHVLVLDLGMPNGSSIETISQLREQAPTTEIAVLTMEDDPGFAEQAINAGALCFVLKDRADTELAEAVRSAARGDEYLSPLVAARLESQGRITAGDELTRREGEVLRMIALGHTSAEIGARTHLSRRTVEIYRARIHGKLGLATRSELVGYALRGGLMEI